MEKNSSLSAEDTEQPRLRDSDSSQGSNEIIGYSARSGSILVGYNLEEYGTEEHKKFKINFSFNSVDRADTYLTGSQGDHATAYVAIINAFLEFASDETINQIGEEIELFARNLLADNSEEILSKITLKDSYPDGTRSKLQLILARLADNPEITSALFNGAEEVLTLTKTESNALNSSLKRDKVRCRADYITELSSVILTEMQQKETTTFYKTGRIMGAAGKEERTAPRALMMLNILTKLNKETDDGIFQKKLDFFVKSLHPLKRKSNDTEADHVVKYGLDQWYPVNIKKNKKSDELMESLNSAKDISESRKILEILEEDIVSKKKELAEFMGDLLDYERELLFDLDESTTLTKQQQQQDPKQQKESRILSLKKRFPTQSVHLFDNEEVTTGSKMIISLAEPLLDKSSLAIVRRSNSDELLAILRKHIYVLNAAFPEIDFNSVQDLFIQNEVLEKQGWKSQFSLSDQLIPVYKTEDYLLKNHVVSTHEVVIESNDNSITIGYLQKQTNILAEKKDQEKELIQAKQVALQEYICSALPLNTVIKIRSINTGKLPEDLQGLLENVIYDPNDKEYYTELLNNEIIRYDAVEQYVGAVKQFGNFETSPKYNTEEKKENFLANLRNVLYEVPLNEDYSENLKKEVVDFSKSKVTLDRQNRKMLDNLSSSLSQGKQQSAAER